MVVGLATIPGKRQAWNGRHHRHRHGTTSNRLPSSSARRINITWGRPKMSLDARLLTENDIHALEHTVLVRHRLEEQYEDLDQQSETAVLGIWLFLATEIMFFGTLFTALGVYRYLYPAAFEQASRALNWQV